MLAALAAVAIPIIIHLLNRRRARVVEWGAMRFLLGSVAARNRRIMLEEIILMVLRCLLVALVVLAVAGPFLIEESMIPWGLVLPAFIAAVICIGIAGAMWRYARARWRLLLVAAALIFLAGATSAAEYYSQKRLWPSDSGGKDLAVVLDGSVSMGLRAGGQGRTNFEQGIAEVREILKTCHPSDTVSLIVAGSLPREVLPGPTADRAAIERALRDLQPSGGSMHALRALQGGFDAAKAGHNTTQRIILIGDMQDVAWNLSNEAAWQGQAKRMAGEEGTRRPQIICRKLPLPEEVVNGTLTGIEVSQTIVAKHRPVKIRVTVRNHGDQPVTGARVELLIEGTDQRPRQDIKDIPQDGSEVATFEHEFEQSGPHVVTARLTAAEDEIEIDNVASRVISVIDKLPVLLIEGAPSKNIEDSGTGFARIALSLAEEKDNPKGGAGEPGGEDRPGGAERRREKVESIAAPTVIDATDFDEATDLGAYRAVILANVPRLPEAAARKLAAYVSGGGGLLVLAGDRVQGAFYNDWLTETGRRLMPAKLPEKRTPLADPVPLSLKSFSVAGLRRLIDEGESDIADAAVSVLWTVTSFDDEKIPVVGTLDNGAPLLLERPVDKGTVMLATVSFDGHDTNLPRRNCFVPLLHELVFRLAEAGMADNNIEPGMEIRLAMLEGRLPRNLASEVKAFKVRLDPDGKEVLPEMPLPVSFQWDEKEGKTAVRASFNRTEEPGLYRIQLPPRLAEKLLKDTPAEQKGIPYVVVGDPAESRLSVLSDNDQAKLTDYFKAEGIKFTTVNNTRDLSRAVVGDAPGPPLWRYLAIGVLLLLVGEIALTRWIAAQRRMTTAEAVTFGTSAEDIRSYRARAKQLVALPSRQPQTAGKP